MKGRIDLQKRIPHELLTEAKTLENTLKNISQFDSMNNEAVNEIFNMISKKKRELVDKVYKKQHPRSKGFCKTARGLYKATGTNITGKTLDELYQKLYAFYFESTFDAVFQEWVKERYEEKRVSNKTIEEDISYYRRIISLEEFAHKNISSITPKEMKHVFYKWTGQGFITYKEFQNRKAVLNGVFNKAVIDDLIQYNPIASIRSADFNFKIPDETNAYTIDECVKLQEYILSKEDFDMYDLAILFSGHSLVRIGEIKGLKKESFNENYVSIENQLINEHEIVMEKDGTFRTGKVLYKDKYPKGKTRRSKRKIALSSETLKILELAKELNPDGEYLFMYKGRPLTTDTYNRRLKKYCNILNIPYRSSHKIRFTNAARLHQEGKISQEQLAIYMGHAKNSPVTAHYSQVDIGLYNETIEKSKDLMASVLDLNPVTKCNQNNEELKNPKTLIK